MITHNFNPISLLGNIDIHYKIDNKLFIFHMPSIKEMFCDGYDYNIFLSLGITPFSELGQHVSESFESRLQFFQFLLTPGNQYAELMMHFLSVIMRGFTYDTINKWIICNGFIVDEQVLIFLLDTLTVASGNKTYTEFIQSHAVDERKKTQEELEWERKEREYAQKINSIKSGGKINIENMLYAISYTFHMSIEELINKNFYTIYSLYAQCLKIDGYNLLLLCESQGHVKEGHQHHYWAKL